MCANFSRWLLVPILCLSLAACASSPKTRGSPEASNTDTSGPVIQEPVVEGESLPEVYGPSEFDLIVPSPEPETKREDAKLCVVLGPGMAKALAQASVLEAIRKAAIPVHCVVGTETGAIVGALYAFSNGSTNNLQWQLFKLNKSNYFSFPMISLREPRSSGKSLNEFLRKVFKNKTIETLPIKFATTAYDTEKDAVVNFEQGDLVSALSASLATPEIFEPWTIGDNSYQSSAMISPAPIELAKKLGGNFFVLVDVIEDASGTAKSGDRFQKVFATVRNVMRFQKRDASFVIQVNAGAIHYDDFSRQGEILSAGAKAAEASMSELKTAWEKFSAGSH